MNLWVMAFPFLVFLGSVGTYSSALWMLVMLKASVGDVAMGIVAMSPTREWAEIGYLTILPYVSISLSLNIILTLMIVVRLILHARHVRTTTGSPPEFSGLYKTVATMLIESSALFAVTSLLVIGTVAADSAIANLFPPILAEIQVRVFPRLRSLDKLSHETTDGQVIASLLIVQRAANRSALAREAIAAGSMAQFGTRSQKGLTDDSSALPSGHPMGSEGEPEADSPSELVFVVKSVMMDIHQEKV